ncbi:MAG TPA: protein kinase [Bryobacteraceae bacterium]|jgi:Tol biopolymer transport system component/predicted Ser/Thr protein kinase|nr:protein kinase [Bryobacteraceae bacterium]
MTSDEWTMDASGHGTPAPGTQVGPYRIEAVLGAGGMGQVFRAVDTRLGRPVAIKFSHERFSERFEREARAISALNHPNICTLYDVGENYLVMELVEGETLGARLKKGTLPMDHVLRYGAEIADALAEAHAKGITHRDLKPGNIMLAKNGVKVLDFGLARSVDDNTLTLTNAVMGTPAYMAPEQREGRSCDGRTDIYALGLILAEMATGKRQTTEGLSGPFGHVVERCLAKEPDDRWQSARDVGAELLWAGKAPSAAGESSHAPGHRWVIAAIVILCTALLGVGFSWLRRSALPPDAPVRFALTVDGQTNDAAPEPSPDGRYMVASALDSSGKRLLWIRPVSESEGHWIAGTNGAGLPFWSGDGRWIGFFAEGRIKKISPAGGSPQTVVEVPGIYAASWNAAGDIVYAPNNRSGLYRIKESGGPPQALTKLDASRTENSHRWPRFLPDGRHFVFTARCTDARNNAVYLGSLDSPETRRLGYVESQVADVPGALLFVREGTLLRQAFDGDKLSGEPAAIEEHVLSNTISAQSAFGASADGRVVLIRPATSGGNTLTWFKRDGAAAGTLGMPGTYFEPRITPDGGRVVFQRPDGDHGNRDLWSIDTRSGATFRLTTNPANDLEHVLSPDGKQILFASDRAGRPEMEFYRKNSLEADEEQKLDFGMPQGQFDLMDWSHDGKWVAFHGHTQPDNEILIAPLLGDRKAFTFLKTRFSEFFPRFSPDSKWIAYTSDESGKREIYVRPFTGGPAGDSPAIPVSNNGGGYHVWSRDGAELFYLAPDFKMYSVQTHDLKAGSLPASTALFTACPATQPLYEVLGGYPYDVAPDGRFLIVCRSGQSSFLVTVKR